jgi:hypothetical protein
MCELAGDVTVGKMEVGIMGAMPAEVGGASDEVAVPLQPTDRIRNAQRSRHKNHNLIFNFHLIRCFIQNYFL